MVSVTGRLPKFSGGSGDLLRIAPILNGSNHVYFGSGQWPCMANTPVGYKPPSKWMDPNSILRIPQMVCFTSILFSYPVSPYISMVQSVQSTIQSLRPNRTWVDIFDFRSYVLGPVVTGFPNPNNIPPYSGPALANWDYMNNVIGTSEFLYLMAPLPGDKFFGTNFLNIFTSDTTNRNTVITPGGGEYELVPCDDLAYSKYTACKAQLSVARPFFANYSAYLYAYGNQSESSYDQYIAVFTGICNDMASLGYQYGGQMDTMSADGLVGVIASHFGFDPATGKDLPVA